MNRCRLLRLVASFLGAGITLSLQAQTLYDGVGHRVTSHQKQFNHASLRQDATGYLANSPLSVSPDTNLRIMKKGNHALWFQGGLGIASTAINERGQSFEPGIHLDLCAHFRWNNRIVAVGADGQGLDLWGINTYWVTYGRSYFKSWLESTLSAGVGFSQWHYHTESARGTIHSNIAPGLMVRAETILHAPQIYGLGFVLIGSIGGNSSYFAGGFVFTLGLWNW